MNLIALSKIDDYRTGRQSILVTLNDGDKVASHNVSSTHHHFDKIKNLVEDFTNNRILVEEFCKTFTQLVEPIQEVREKLTRVADVSDGRLSIRGSRVFFDHDPVDPTLEAHILRLLNEDGSPRNLSNWKAFAKFVEKLYANMDAHIRDQFFGWLSYESFTGSGFTLTKDGNLIGYKGCAGTPEMPVSVHHGPAIVDGEPVNGAVPNVIGSTVEMARSKVTNDPRVGCAAGLHVGTYDYAKGWARGVLLTVEVDPRDVVSVPTDCDAQKIRVCRYKVIDSVEQKIESTGYYGDDDEYDDEYGDEYGDDYSDGHVSAVDFEIGRQYTIEYRKISGEVKKYTFEVEDIFSDSILAVIGGNEYRTFMLDSILEVEEFEKEVDYEDDYEDEDEIPSSLTVDDIEECFEYIVTYRKANGDVKEYTIRVLEDWGTYFRVDVDGKLKTFTREGILTVRPVDFTVD